MQRDAPDPLNRATREVAIGPVTVGDGTPFVIAGPCVIEEQEALVNLACRLAEMADTAGIAMVFKASFDKANRTSLGSFRGPGLEEGLDILAQAREASGLPVLTDVHLPEQAERVGQSVDCLQVPAFLCRQTDLAVACGETGKAVNLKKGQFVDAATMGRTAEKVESTGNENVLLTERGTFFGYGRLVVDFAGLDELRALGRPVVLDATHSVQRPSGADGQTGGDRRLAPALARAAAAFGVDGHFFEVHPDPDSSPSDGPNMVQLDDFPAVLTSLQAVRDAAGG